MRNTLSGTPNPADGSQLPLLGVFRAPRTMTPHEARAEEELGCESYCHYLGWARGLEMSTMGNTLGALGCERANGLSDSTSISFVLKDLAEHGAPREWLLECCRGMCSSGFARRTTHNLRGKK